MDGYDGELWTLPKMKSVSVMCIYGGNFSIVVGNNAGGKIVCLLVFNPEPVALVQTTQHNILLCFATGWLHIPRVFGSQINNTVILSFLSHIT